MPKIDQVILSAIVARALEEDIGAGDITTFSLIPANEEAEAELIVKEDCIVAGLVAAEEVFRQLDPRIRFEVLLADGARAERGIRLALFSGPARAILTGERTALNFLQRLSGIATLTRRYVELIKDTGATILDTRKTTPGLRQLEKYAVAVGGGMNHRMGLYDRILIKDNHLRVLERYGADSIRRAIAEAKQKNPGVPVEVEADSLEAVGAAVEAGADCILLDNMTIDEMREAVELVDRRAATEASGGITLENVREVALTGVQYISIGALTHSAKAVDMSLEVIRPGI